MAAPKIGPAEPGTPAGKPRRFDGKPIAIGLAAFLVIGTALTIYFASQNMYARQRAFQAADAADAAASGHP